MLADGGTVEIDVDCEVVVIAEFWELEESVLVVATAETETLEELEVPGVSDAEEVVVELLSVTVEVPLNETVDDAADDAVDDVVEDDDSDDGTDDVVEEAEDGCVDDVADDVVEAATVVVSELEGLVEDELDAVSVVEEVDIAVLLEAWVLEVTVVDVVVGAGGGGDTEVQTPKML